MLCLLLLLSTVLLQPSLSEVKTVSHARNMGSEHPSDLPVFTGTSIKVRPWLQVS